MVLRFSKEVHFLQFGADLSRKPKSVKLIYIFAYESSNYTLRNGGRVTVLEIVAIKISKKMLTQQNFNKIL